DPDLAVVGEGSEVVDDVEFASLLLGEVHTHHAGAQFVAQRGVVPQDPGDLEKGFASHVEGDLPPCDLDPLHGTGHVAEPCLQVVGDPVEVGRARVVGSAEGTPACGEGPAPDLEATETGGVSGVPGAEHATAFDRCRKAFTASLIGQALVRLVTLALVLVGDVCRSPSAEAACAVSAA